jgi:hypothetical protein
MPKKSTTRKLTWRDYSVKTHRSFPTHPNPESSVREDEQVVVTSLVAPGVWREDLNRFSP